MMRMHRLAVLAVVTLCGTATFAIHAAHGQEKTQAADPAAVAMLKEAHDKRSTFPADFPGLTADVTINDNGKEARGTVTYSSVGDLKLTLNDASKSEEEWAQEQLGSAFSHRRADDFAQGDGSHSLTCGPDDHSPLGRLIALNDRFKSTNRVKDGHITEVTRTMGKMRFTITVLEDKTVEGGKYLPSQFVVTYFDAATGAIQKVDAYSDRFVKVSNAWIPSARRVVTAENGSFVARTLALDHVRLLGTTTASAK